MPVIANVATMRETLARIMSDEEFRQMAVLMATPIDFEQLVADGVLKKRGRGWQVLDMKRLPEHAAKKIQSVSCNRKTRVTIVTFCREYPRKR